jgi:hypothetical protein
MQFEKERKDAIRNILGRNPSAFDTKFKKTADRNNINNNNGNNPTMTMMMTTATANATTMSLADKEQQARILSHKLGCKCRKSACMKKYCECYAGNVKCSGNCRCVGCKNMPPGGLDPGSGNLGATTARVAVVATREHKHNNNNNMSASSSSEEDNMDATSSDTSKFPRRREPWMMNAAQNLVRWIKKIIIVGLQDG